MRVARVMRVREGVRCCVCVCVWVCVWGKPGVGCVLHLWVCEALEIPLILKHASCTTHSACVYFFFLHAKTHKNAVVTL